MSVMPEAKLGSARGESVMSVLSERVPRGWPWTFWAGLGVIVAVEAALFLDVYWRGGVVVGRGELAWPTTLMGVLARQIGGGGITPLAWCGYLLLMEGLLTRIAWGRGEAGGSCVRQRPWLFVVTYLTSVLVWCYWDWINFYFIDAWRYHGLSGNVYLRYTGYFLAFAAISPAMFLAAELYLKLGMQWWSTNTGKRAAHRVVLWCLFIAGGLAVGVTWLWRDRLAFGLGPWETAALLLVPGLLASVASRGNVYVTSIVMGVGWVAYSFVVGNPVGNFVMWAAPLFVLDPINHRLGRPSILYDWVCGRWGRTAALMAGGLTCGLLWEFWNYWAAAKWTYDLPFLGVLERVKYFEMPVVGLVGFLPFGVTCWVMLQTLLVVVGRMTEPLGTEHDVM